jgi:hypothetical protein
VDNSALLQRLLATNIEAEKPRMAPSATTEMVLSIFSGLRIERNLKSGNASSRRKIENFMMVLAEAVMNFEPAYGLFFRGRDAERG